MYKLVYLSDCHSQLPKHVPKGDILIMGGDMEPDGGPEGQFDWIKNTFRRWINGPCGHFKHKIFIGGNHSWWTDILWDERCKGIDGPYSQFVDKIGLSVLFNQKITLEGITFFGSPFCKRVGNWNYGWEELDWKINTDMWPKNGIDVLITHGPPMGILDHMLRYHWDINELRTEYTGSKALRDYVLKLKPRIHCFGHIHPHFGQKMVDDVLFINGAQLNDGHEYVNHPIEIFLPQSPVG